MTALLDGIDLHPRDVDSALVALNTVVARLAARNDARAVFPDVYGIITRNVAREVRRGDQGLFLEPAWISRLAGRFAERYLETLAWSLRGEPQDCAAWDIAYRAASAGTTVPLDDAALGISAHINFDLALGLWQTIEEMGDTTPEKLARYKHDHDAVNALLAESLPEAVARLEERYGCTVTPWIRRPALMPMTSEVALFVLGLWRAHVWEDVLALVHAPDRAAQQAVITRMHQRSHSLGRVLSVGSEVRRLARTWGFAPARAALSRVRPAPVLRLVPAPVPVPVRVRSRAG
ncbi:hypothetical protein JY651_35250 [Pyxidicoccus parkwayensis]|uniref:Uncharacterized protein n=1 Tax=Pyxidicoccus parkwayensis TaxID=2813578 RepID=A0ABX7NQ21_9BACT|nr:DUF5995 family protein [Pyxidicoccus parkwaysis]QSQ20469.1 hypothetical protein JY651_35250 [Pyxidicoccus parkwaysis]